MQKDSGNRDIITIWHQTGVSVYGWASDVHRKLNTRQAANKSKVASMRKRRPLFETQQHGALANGPHPESAQGSKGFTSGEICEAEVARTNQVISHVSRVVFCPNVCGSPQADGRCVLTRAARFYQRSRCSTRS